MKILSGYSPVESAWGGMNTFFRQFNSSLNNSGMGSSKNEAADIYFFGSFYKAPGKRISVNDIINIQKGLPSGLVYRVLKKELRQPKIIQRLDGLRGVYTDTDQSNSDDDLQLELARMSDHLIFQSEYSRLLFKSKGVNISDSAVIHNGADQRIFYPSQNCVFNPKRIRIACVSWSKNLKKGFNQILEYAKLPSVEVYFAGNWPDNLPNYGVQLMGNKYDKSLADFYRSCNFLLFPSENESCPNVVLEALSCGLPVLYHPSGGTSEIVKEAGIAMTESKEADIEKMILEHGKMTTYLKLNTDLFSFKRTFAQYIATFKEWINE